jgi:hypothetical protein
MENVGALQAASVYWLYQVKDDSGNWRDCDRAADSRDVAVMNMRYVCANDPVEMDRHRLFDFQEPVKGFQ